MPQCRNKNTADDFLLCEKAKGERDTSIEEEARQASWWPKARSAWLLCGLLWRRHEKWWKTPLNKQEQQSKHLPHSTGTICTDVTKSTFVESFAWPSNPSSAWWTSSLHIFARRVTINQQRISPKVRLYVYLRWLAGVPYTAICDLTGISRPTCYRLINQVCADIMRCKSPEVDNVHFVFPKTMEEVEVKKATGEFRSISHKGILPYVVSANDGCLLRINSPPKKIHHEMIDDSSDFRKGRYSSIPIRSLDE